MSTDKEVKCGKKFADTFKAKFPFNNMVEYLTKPASDKTVDENPIYINCTADTIWLEVEDMMDACSNEDLVVFARDLKDANVAEADAMQMIAARVSKDRAVPNQRRPTKQ
jgi:hypothetical protein